MGGGSEQRRARIGWQAQLRPQGAERAMEHVVARAHVALGHWMKLRHVQSMDGVTDPRPGAPQFLYARVVACPNIAASHGSGGSPQRCRVCVPRGGPVESR